MRDADDRRNASIITHSSMMFRSTSEQVGWTTNTSVPRMFSSIWNEHSVSGNRCKRACPIETPRNSAISAVRAACALPENSFSCPRLIVLVGAEGFEPSNTGSKVPRLTSLATPQKTAPRPRPGAPLENDKCSREKAIWSNAAQDRTGPGFVFGARQGAAQHDRVGQLGEGPERADGRRAGAEQTEHRRAAAGHRRGDRPRFAQGGLDGTDLRVAADDRRLEIVDHLCGTARPRDRQDLQLAARLPHPGGAILVVPGIRLDRRHAKRRPDQDDPVAGEIDQR